MKAIILAGGFARRLRPLSSKTPKPLLKVRGKTIIDYVFDKVLDIESVDRALISINLKFKDQFEEWLRSKNLPKASLVVEPSLREEEKLGAIGALARIAESIQDDCLIVAGDNLFTSSIKPLIERSRITGSPIVGIYDVGDKQLAKEYSTVRLDSDGRIVRFVEKPANPETTLIGTAIYVLPRHTLRRLREFVELSPEHDSLGHFIEWLSTVEPTYGVVLNGEWWDIGTLDQYNKVNRASVKHEIPCEEHAPTDYANSNR